jgi:hypothetical protein
LTSGSTAPCAARKPRPTNCAPRSQAREAAGRTLAGRPALAAGSAAERDVVARPRCDLSGDQKTRGRRYGRSGAVTPPTELHGVVSARGPSSSALPAIPHRAQCPYPWAPNLETGFSVARSGSPSNAPPRPEGSRQAGLRCLEQAHAGTARAGTAVADTRRHAQCRLWLSGSPLLRLRDTSNVALDIVRRPKATPIHELERYMRPANQHGRRDAPHAELPKSAKARSRGKFGIGLAARGYGDLMPARPRWWM